MSNLQLGRVQPSCVDIEYAVIGQIIHESKSVAEVIDLLQPEMFYEERHQIIYHTIYKMFQQGQEIDFLTLINQLKVDGDLELVGGPSEVSQFTNDIVSVAHIESHALLIIEKWMLREIARICLEAARAASEEAEDVFELLDNTIVALLKVNEVVSKGISQDIKAVVKDTMDRITYLLNHKNEKRGIQTLIHELDVKIIGFQGPDLITIAGRPGMGKTAFLVTLVTNIAIKQNRSVGFISMEMSAQQLVVRLLSQEVSIPYNRIINGELDGAESVLTTEASLKVSAAPIHIDDSSALNIVQLRAKVLRMKQLFGIEILFIDYLQLMSGMSRKGQNRESEISEISRGCKAIAKDLNIPVVQLSQLSRKVEDRGGDKRPKLSDLRESGAIEQDSDLVIFLYRPSYYKFKHEERNGEKVEIPHDRVEFMVEKHRNGPVGTVESRFIGSSMMFKGEETEDMPESDVKEDTPF